MKKQDGFTLIEVMIVVALIGIVTAIALPNYTEYMMRARRAEARSALQQAALWLEKSMTATGTYPTAIQFNGSGLTTVQSGTYTLTLVTNGTAYTLSATPIGAQSTDLCSVLTLNDTGVRGAPTATSPMDAIQCWQR